VYALSDFFLFFIFDFLNLIFQIARPTLRRRVENYNCDARARAANQGRPELCDRLSMGHRAVRLPYRSNSIVRSRGLPSLVLGSCLSSAVV